MPVDEWEVALRAVTGWYQQTRQYEKDVEAFRERTLIQHAMNTLSAEQVGLRFGVPLPEAFETLTIQIARLATRLDSDPVPFIRLRRGGVDQLSEARVAAEALVFKIEHQVRLAKRPRLPLPQADGPAPPNQFWWKGKKVEVQPQSWRLLAAVWDADGRSLPAQVAIRQAWTKPNRALPTANSDAVKSAIKKINKALLDAGYPGSIGAKADHFVITSVP